MRAMNDGIQKPVLTFTKAAATNDPPMMKPSTRWAVWKLHPAAMSRTVAEVQPKRRRARNGAALALRIDDADRS